MWPSPLARLFDLPRAPDSRLQILTQGGAKLGVENVKGTIFVYVEGVTPDVGQTNEGLKYLSFRP